MLEFMQSPVFTWVVLPLLIFLSRIVDVSLGTIRIIFVSKGKRFLAPALGFFEALLWLLAMGQIMQHLTNIMAYVAYAGGFAAGNFVGIYLEEKLAMGVLVVRVITTKEADSLVHCLVEEGYGVTALDAQGSTGPVKLIYTVIKRKNLERVVAIIQEFNPKAFFSVEDTRSAKEGIFPGPRSSFRDSQVNRLRLRKKMK